ncbi:hypothetical protein GF327_00590 [Candidatus Woesearchaeota archaeon]|nr:hypothetical protein [Candidatus Woesearchaeota archaeon]
MKKLILSILVIIAATTVFAGSATFNSDWGDCNPAGNYGGWDKESACYVAWDPVDGACPESTRDATFVVGDPSGDTDYVQIVIEHLDGIAGTADNFEILDENDNVVCAYTADEGSNPETWYTLFCDVSFSGEQTWTLHPTADSPWNQCGTYGQVAITSIEFNDEDNYVPEFSVLSAAAVLGVIGLFVFFKRKE